MLFSMRSLSAIVLDLKRVTMIAKLETRRPGKGESPLLTVM